MPAMHWVWHMLILLTFAARKRSGTVTKASRGRINSRRLNCVSQAERLHDRLLLILSEHSMNSEWVNTEIATARKREVKEGRRVCFPSGCWI